MGAQVGKSKRFTITRQVNGQKKELYSSTSNQPIDGIVTLDRKQEKKSNKYGRQKSLDLRFDKSTGTEIYRPGSLSTSTSCIKHVVNQSVSNSFPYDAQSYTASHSEMASKDVLEFREACIRRGIISPEFCYTNFPASIDEDQQNEILEESLEAIYQQEKEQEHEQEQEGST